MKNKVNQSNKVNEEKLGNSTSVQHYCSLKIIPPREFAPNVSLSRASFILLSDRKWVNGTKLRYYFFKSADGSPSNWEGNNIQMRVVRQAFKVWEDLGIGLKFEEVDDKSSAEIRIGFLQDEGSWSYIGRDIIDKVPSPNERTMNFGWDISNQIDTALHEIGHTLGAPHEHQNPIAGIVWNEEAVYQELAQPPNYWSREETFHNIIKKLPRSEVVGSTHDPNSIMHYPFAPGLIKAPLKFVNGIYPAGGISAKDIEFVKKYYPPLKSSDYLILKETQSQNLNIKAGEQLNFKFTPLRSKRYNIATFGKMDTVMVLFEKVGDEEIYMSGDDDSGTDNNSKIYMRLIKSRDYIIRVRLYFAEESGNGSIMIY